jgi:hypothetical protein
MNSTTAAAAFSGNRARLRSAEGATIRSQGELVTA